jgi:hypothetical protein
VEASQCALTAPGVHYPGRVAAFHFAVSNIFAFNATLQTDCNFYNSKNADLPVYMTGKAVKALTPYGPVFFHALYWIAPALGAYGKRIFAVLTEADVDDHLSKSVT